MVNFEEEKAITIDLQNEEPIQTEVYDINHLPSYKIAEEERRANEKERIANENERKDYYNDFASKVDSGYFDGDNGVYVGSEPPTDEEVTVWIDPNGTPEVEAKNIVFSDNESLQTKYENGDLKGEKGDKGEDGTMSFSDLTEEQKASLKGDKGDKGDTGEKGQDGTDGKDGYTPVKGVDYFTEDDIASLNIPTKTSQLNNDSGYITTIPSEYVTETELDNVISNLGTTGNSTNNYTRDEEVIGTWIDGKKIYRKVFYVSGSLTFNSYIFAFNHNISNFEKPLKLNGIIYDNENKDYYILPYVTTGTANIMLFASPTQIKVEQIPYGSGRLSNLYVIMEYTKTTD